MRKYRAEFPDGTVISELDAPSARIGALKAMVEVNRSSGKVTLQELDFGVKFVYDLTLILVTKM